MCRAGDQARARLARVSCARFSLMNASAHVPPLGPSAPRPQGAALPARPALPALPGRPGWRALPRLWVCIVSCRTPAAIHACIRCEARAGGRITRRVGRAHPQDFRSGAARQASTRRNRRYLRWDSRRLCSWLCICCVCSAPGPPVAYAAGCRWAARPLVSARSTQLTAACIDPGPGHHEAPQIDAPSGVER